MLYDLKTDFSDRSTACCGALCVRPTCMDLMLWAYHRWSLGYSLSQFYKS